jgi:hypothetical protein
MKEINTQESNLFSRNIVELKLISDRIAEGNFKGIRYVRV